MSGKRPRVSYDMAKDIESYANRHTRLDASKLDFADQLKIVLEEYEEMYQESRAPRRVDEFPDSPV